MNRVVEILMRRDKLTKKEADKVLNDVREMMEECNYDPQECEEIMYSQLGLEMDYLYDIL